MFKPIYLGQILYRDGNSFDLVRLIMALLVIVSHAVGITNQTNIEPLQISTGYTLGAHAVHGFFVLSGILVMASWQRIQNFQVFFIARISRLFPALIVVTLCLGFIIGPLLSTTDIGGYFSDNRLPLFIIKSIFFLTGSGQLPGVFETITEEQYVNVTLWTLKYEVVCYLFLGFFGVIGLLKGEYRSRLVLIVILIACIGRMMLNVPSSEHGFFDHLARLGFAFGLGALFWSFKTKLLISPFVLAGIGASAYVLHSTPFALPAMILFTGYATLVAGSFYFGALSRLTRRNDVSYGMYIIGYPAQQALFMFFPTMTGLLNAALTIVVVLPLAFLSWYFVENPALRLKNYFDLKKAPKKAELL